VRSNPVMRRLAILSMLLVATPMCCPDRTLVFRATSELVLVDLQVLHTKTGVPAPATPGQRFPNVRGRRPSGDPPSISGSEQESDGTLGFIGFL
jgi:hypothetical protein